MTRRCHLTTAIPFVNAPPHVGFALELVQADVLVRHHRTRGWDVRFQSGTDDHSLKNVLAAEAAGVPVRRLVDANAATFAALKGPLRLSFDDFIRTSRDPRHRPGVERLWRACAAAGDLYRRTYTGRYCVGCEQFYVPADLIDEGHCPEHGVEPETVTEDNWFFRLSRYEGALHDLISSGRLRIEPESRRNEALGFIAGGLEDFSVSRPATRARGWGIPVPGDPNQVIYVWFDALANYITALGYGTPTLESADHRRWWLDGDRRVHVIGKGILRFHAVYWPAILLSAGLPPPTDILVHDYLTVDGRKIGKSLGNAVNPVELVDRYGADALRWWLLRDVPRVGEADFTETRLVERANADLANGFGNLAGRVITLTHRRLGGAIPPASVLGQPERRLLAVTQALPGAVDEAIDGFDLRRAAGTLLDVVTAANRYLDTVQPWKLSGSRLESAVAVVIETGRTIAVELAPFVPDLAQRLLDGFGGPTGTTVPAPESAFPRLATELDASAVGIRP